MTDWALHFQALPETLGEDVTITRGAGAPVALLGIFESAATVADVGVSGVMSAGPRLSFMTIDYAVEVDDVVTRKGVQYRVKTKFVYDPVGMTVVELRRV